MCIEVKTVLQHVLITFSTEVKEKNPENTKAAQIHSGLRGSEDKEKLAH